jgi:hypothetical protein
MTCQKCGTANASDATNCSNCGEALSTQSAGATPAQDSSKSGCLSLIGGLVAGAIVTPLLWLTNASLFSNMWQGRGYALANLLELLGVAALLVYLFVAPASRRLPASLRLFFLSVTWVVLGAEFICSAFSTATLFNSP